MSAEEKSKTSKAHELYGSFFLNESEFALAVTSVQEVVNAPDTYTSLPLAPHYFKGLFNLRGSIVPIVDLRSLLKLSEAELTEKQKIAIVELNTGFVGLLFDRTGEIFRSHEEERGDFEDAAKAQIVSGVFKKEDGARIVQILNVDAIFKLSGIPHEVAGRQRSRNRLAQKRGQRKQCISFVVGPAKCALGIAEIQEILKIEKVNASALASDHCLGTIDLRGTTVPILDFAAFLQYRNKDHSTEATGGDRRVVVMKIATEFFGLLVDSVDSIISYFPDELIAFPVIEQNRAAMYLGCLASPNSNEVLLLNHKNIFTNTEINEITHGHSRIYSNNALKLNGDKKAKGGLRKTYITFLIENIYAIGIDEINEIIDCPKTLLQVPGLPSYFRGVHSIRGEMVSVIDARTMYLMKPREQSFGDEKVLVFKRAGVHFGLIVDAVESIVSFSEKEKIKLPEMLYLVSAGHLAQDIVEAVEASNGMGEKRNLLILSADSIASRVNKSDAA